MKTFKTKMFFYLCVSMPVIWLFGMILYYGVNVPFWDEWELIKLVSYFKQNGFEVWKIFAQHNEHRIFFPEIILLLSGLASHWNVKIQMLISGCMLASIYGITLKWFYSRKINHTACDKYLFPLLIGLVLLSPVQYENLLWGFELTFVMVVLNAFCSFYYFDKFQETKIVSYFYLMLVFAFMATFSSMQGLVVWLVYGLIIIIKLISNIKLERKAVLFGLIVGISSWGLYFFDYHQLEYSYKMFDGGILQIIKVFFVNIGGVAVWQNMQLSYLIGVLIFLFSFGLLVYIYINHHIEKNWFPLCLMIFGYGVIAMTSIGRAGLGIGFTSRYSTYVLMMIVGILLIVWREFLSPFVRTKITKIIYIQFAILFIFLIPILLQNLTMQNTLKEVKLQRKERQLILVNYKQMSLEELDKIYPWGTLEDAMRDINIIEENSFSVFSEKFRK